jgi:hypothetical protein
MFHGNSGNAHSFSQRGKLNVVNYHPATWPNEPRNANQVQRRSRMLVVGIDEDQLEFSGMGNLFDIASVFAGVHADPARQAGDKLRNLEAHRFRWIGQAVLVQIDRVHDHRLRFWPLVLGHGVSDYGRGKAAQGADLYHPIRCENVDESMKKQQVAHSYRSRAVAMVGEQMFQTSTLSREQRRRPR